ncbi:MAG: alanine dehydrogenase [Deltaproteobacteria bacterium]|nr:alanine dehydrogenase [Deltaproteobacteria bacterium]
MLIGVPGEVKIKEHRVSMVPGGVRQLVHAGHRVLIQAGAGNGAGICDQDYQEAGASIVPDAETVWGEADMIIKVKEPIAQEYPLMKKHQILYTYLHLAAVPELAEQLVKKEISAIAYETIQNDDGFLPLLKPMSEVAGRMAVQVGVRCLEKRQGGKGLLLGGVPGVRRGKVGIIGAGFVGVNAAKMAIGLGAQVSILDIDQQKLAYLDDVFGSTITTLMSDPENIARVVSESDLLIGAVLLPGARAPVLVTREMVASMEKGSAIVDVAIDQGGSVETIRPTTHDQPTYTEEGVIHYGVTNMPGNVPATSTYALTNVTMPFALSLANKGLEQALRESRPLARGLNTHQGRITHEVVAQALETPSG